MSNVHVIASQVGPFFAVSARPGFMKRTALITALSIAGLGLAGCGGGGAGSSSSPDPVTEPPPPPPPPPVSQPVAITTQNAIQVALEAGMAVDNTYFVAMAAVNRAVGLVDSGGTFLRVDCDEGGSLVGGSVTVTHVDADGDGAVGAGDSFRIEYADECYEGGLNDRVTGVVRLDITDWYRGDGSGFYLEARATFQPTLVTSEPSLTPVVALTGGFDVTALAASGTSFLEVRTPDGAQVTNEWSTFDQPGVIHESTLSNLRIRHEERVNPDDAQRFEFTLDFEVASEALGGTVSCETPIPVRGDALDVPDFFEYFDCTGANQSRARITWVPTTFEDVPGIDVHVDADGSGSFVFAGGYIADTFELELPFLHWLHNPTAFSYLFRFSDVPSNRLSIDITDSAYDRVADRLYLISGGDLVVVDASSLTELGRLTLPELAGTAALSEDGSTLWLAARDNPTIYAINALTLEYTGEIHYTSPPPPGQQPEYVADLLVMPGSTGFLVAALRHRRELVAFNAGVELPDTLALASAFPDMIALTETGQIVSGLGDLSSQASLAIIDADPVNGLRIAETLPGYLAADAHPLPIYSGSNNVYVLGGRVIDLQRKTMVADLKSFELGPTRFVADSARNRVYALVGSSRLFVYREEPRALLAGYKFDDFALPAVVDVYVTDTHLLITNREQVIQIPLADLKPNIRNDWCKPVDLSGVLLPGTAIEIPCLAVAAAYDALRDRLLVGLSGEAGERGYAIAAFDPSTGNLMAHIPIGSRPGKMRITPDGDLLLVALPDANELAVVNLATASPVEYVPLGFALDTSGNPILPIHPTAIAPGNAGINEFVAAFANGEVALYRDQVRAESTITAEDAYEQLFLSKDGRKALAVTRDQSDLLDVSVTGVMAGTDLGAIFSAGLTQEMLLKQVGDEVFVFNGDIFDLQSGSLSRPCDVPLTEIGTLVVPTPTGNPVTYIGHGINSLTVQSCDRQTGELSSAPLTLLGGSLRFIDGFHMANGLLAIVFDGRIVIVDAP